MKNLLKRLFTGNTATPEEKKAQEDQKRFDILKYDGIRALRIGKADYARKCLEGAYALNDDPELRGYLTTAYLQLNELDKACQLQQAVMEKEPENIQAYLTLGNLYFMQENYTEMVAVLKKGESIDSKQEQIHYLLGKAYHGVKEELLAIAELTRAITLKEDFFEAYLLRGTILQEMSQTEEAANDAAKLLELAPEDEQALMLNGMVACLKGDSDQAYRFFSQVIGVNPFNEKAYENLIGVLMSQQKTEEAMETLNEAIEVHPNAAAFYRLRGQLKLQAGDNEGSAEDLKKSLQLNPDQEKDISGQYRNYNEPFKIDLFRMG